jgi:polyhydroxyalkanoate synthesis regulator phasin
MNKINKLTVDDGKISDQEEYLDFLDDVSQASEEEVKQTENELKQVEKVINTLKNND